MSKELIERLRLMSADTYGNGAADALESLEAAYASAVEAGKALAKQALKADQERDALAAELKALQGQEPAGKLHSDSIDGHVFIPTGGDWSCLGMSLYAHPVPARELTDEAIENLHMQIYKGPSIAPVRMLSFARAIERYLKGEGE